MARLRMPQLESRPLDRLPFRAVSHGGGWHQGDLPLLRGTLPGLPPGLDALLALGDLEAVAGDPPRPLGVAVAEAAPGWAAAGWMPPLARVGVILTGDLYGDPALATRGLAGDVRPVWEALGERFRWVAGVPGNHDRFGGPEARRAFFARPGLHDLDAAPAALDGLRLAGVGGLADPRPRPFHRPDGAYREAVAAALRGAPHLLVTHASPRGRGKRFPGCPVLAEALAPAGEVLVVSGHKHWDRPLHRHAGGGPVLNVDRRVVVLARPPPQDPVD